MPLHADLCASCRPPQTIFRQGDQGDVLYLIKNGTADVTINGVGKVATLINGMAFGERAILNEGDVRGATVVAVSNLVCYALGRRDCHTLLGNVTEVRLIKVLRAVPILAALNQQQLYSMSKLLKLVEYKAGEAVFRKGDIGDAFYIVESGHFVAKVEMPPSPAVLNLQRSPSLPGSAALFLVLLLGIPTPLAERMSPRHPLRQRGEDKQKGREVPGDEEGVNRGFGELENRWRLSPT